MKITSTMLDLLTRHKDEYLVEKLLKEAPASEGFDATGPIALRQIRDIYRQRARHIERTRYPIYGFPELVNGLDKFTGDAITIFHVRFDTGDYAIFADADQTELAGILKFPKRTAAQEVALADSQKQQEAMLASFGLQTV